MPVPVVELPATEWTELPITVEFSAALTPDQEAGFAELVRLWYQDGTLSVFGGPMHSMCPIGFHSHPDAPQTAEWIVDMGDAEQEAIQELAERVSKFATETGVSPTRIVLGWILVD